MTLSACGEEARDLLEEQLPARSSGKLGRKNQEWRISMG